MNSRNFFTEDQVREIRQSPLAARALAVKYGVTHPTIINIRERRTYKHVPDSVGTDLRNQYVIKYAQDFLAELPSGCCPTVVTSAPLREAPYSQLSFMGSPRMRAPSFRDLEEARREYLERQRGVISECLRVAGSMGIVLYHHRFEVSTRRELDTRHALIDGFPLRQIIIWNHHTRGFIQGTPRKNRLPTTYSVIFMFSGPHWSIPEKSLPAAMAWGDSWDIKPDPEHDLLETSSSRRNNRRQRFSFPDELADRCVALGTGTVLDPHAGSGSTALAAIRAGRDWLACDSEAAYLQVFEMRRAMLTV